MEYFWISISELFILLELKIIDYPDNYITLILRLFESEKWIKHKNKYYRTTTA